MATTRLDGYAEGTRTGTRSVRASSRISQLCATHVSRSRGLGLCARMVNLHSGKAVDGAAPLPSEGADRFGTGDACALSRQLIRPVYVDVD